MIKSTLSNILRKFNLRLDKFKRDPNICLFGGCRKWLEKVHDVKIGSNFVVRNGERVKLWNDTWCDDFLPIGSIFLPHSLWLWTTMMGNGCVELCSRRAVMIVIIIAFLGGLRLRTLGNEDFFWKLYSLKIWKKVEDSWVGIKPSYNFSIRSLCFFSSES